MGIVLSSEKGGGSGKYKKYDNYDNYENYILPLLVLAVNVLLMGICFDFYYDLNDDTMMLDIMSGAYSGTPDGHNMQTLYPLGALIALCYRISGRIPWYGLFLCSCQFGCFYLAGVRLCALTERQGGLFGKVGAGGRGISVSFLRIKKLSLLLAESLFLWGVCLSHMVQIQYTVTSAMLSATAIFLFSTSPDTDGAGRFLVRNVPAMALAVLAYQLRSEMLLLTFPYIGLAGLYRLTGEKKIFVKDNLIKYGGVLGFILVGMLGSAAADRAAYGGEAWQDFRRFFEARTTVYDFYPELITEERYEAALTDLGVAPYQQALLRNYNYGLEDTIDTGLLEKMADYATGTLRPAKDWGGIVKEQVYRYCYRTVRGGDAPYSTFLLALYGVILAAGCYGLKRSGVRLSERIGFLWQMLLLAAGRTAIWLFILLRGRDPERITHSLYLVEFALLAALAMRTFSAAVKESGARAVRGILLLVLGLLAAGALPGNLSALRAQQEAREDANGDGLAIDEYCRAHRENFYFEDVYSTVGFSRKIFGNGYGVGYANYDILGGWMCGSPLYREKIGRYGVNSAGQALLEQDRAYLILSDTEAAQQGFGWIEDCYAAQGISVTVREVDRIGEAYAVYQILSRK